MNRNVVCSLAAVAALALLTVPAHAVVITDPSNTFDNQYNGDEIWDGSGFLNDWDQAGGATTASLSLSGSALVVNNDDNNGWVQQDTGSSPWELGANSYAVEVNAKLTDNDPSINDGFTIWTSASDGNRQVIWIQDDSVNLLDGTELAGGMDNTDGFHAYRVAFDHMGDPATDAYHVFRDGVDLTPAGIALQGTESNNRLIVGDCCTSIGNPVDTHEIGYVRYTHIPEPASLALLSLGLIGFACWRRHR